MTYWGANNWGIGRCPTCGYTTLNGICYNVEGHRSSSARRVEPARPAATNNNLSMQNYTNSKLGISIEYPFNWSCSENFLTNGNVHSITFQPQIRNTIDDVVSVIVTVDLLYNRTLQEFINFTMNFMKNNSNQFSFVKEPEPITINGMNGYIVSFRYNSEIIFNLYIQNGRTVYQVGYFARPENYSKHLQEVNAMVNSFRIQNVKNRPSNPTSSSYSEPQRPDPSMSDVVKRGINEAEYGFSTRDW